jgi:hypothetical protein
MSAKTTLLAAAAIGSLTLCSAARAEQYFNNSGVPLHYHIHCYPGGHSSQLVAPGQAMQVSCSNGSAPTVRARPTQYYAPVYPGYYEPRRVWVPAYFNGQFVVPGHWS